MKKFTINDTDLEASVFSLGCMRIAELDKNQLYELIQCALDLGINYFDHADIYGGGKSEELFGEVLKEHPELRDSMIIQSKCDIVFPEKGGPRYDTSKEYIIAQAKKSIEKLNCDYLDVLLIHRPDPLMDPREVAEAFDELESSGLVHYFGVSNFAPSRIEMLQKYVHQPLITDQVQLSAVHALMIDESVFFNMTDDYAASKSGQILDYAMENDLMLQAWCPLQASWEDGTFIDNPKYEKLNAVLKRLASKYDVTKAAIAAAWILKLPAKMQVIAGTTKPEHLKEMAKGAKIELTRQEWYDLYLADKPMP